ncbi:MAG: prepilin-type N-terminal cleavage/methylation domain-containing protein [Phycisphaeraceae bacterium]|nr:prepilin-type N-terminal cleavage/methylation domain-containing protein [Phycisphaeraceae bacterium]
MQNRRPRKGFTLVEILIVVVILGILAAIVIPQFTNASDAAKVSSAKSQLQAIRAQLELYRNNNGVYPATLFGDENSLVSPPAGNGNPRRYLQQAARNPFFSGEPEAGYEYISDPEDVDYGQVRLANIPAGLLGQFTVEDAVDGTLDGEEEEL